MLRLSQSAINRQQYIPPHVQQAISQHLQNTLPGSMKSYMSSGGFVPGRAQKALTKQMEKNLPAHLKQYAGAYMEQNILNPATSIASSAPLKPRPPIPNLTRLDHSNVSSEQFQATFNGNNLFAPDSPPTDSTTQPHEMSAGSLLPPQPASSAQQQSPYEFITADAPKPSRSLNILGSSSKKQRIMIVLGGAVLLIIIAIVFASILNKKPSSVGLVSLAQQQNEMITTATSAGSQATQQVTQNLTTTIQLSLITDQNQLLAFMKSANMKKISSKQLAAGTSTVATQDLANAQAASNFDAVYIQITQKQLTTYAETLKQVFASTNVISERQLLNTQYQAARLLLAQASNAASSLQSS
ncbi:MAG TPA: hypothetical protein VMR28_02225 [Candidatus Saccharimonadales bacterium]|nr:hypothetical protein [Candidatus Saccharimonadales bacterium]